MSKKILTLDNVPVINKKIGKIDTIEKLKASTIYSLGDVVEVLGFHAKGDGSHHKRVAKSEDDGSGEQGQNGIWWCIVHNGEVNVSWFGAKGDGINDDTEAFEKMISIGHFKILKPNVSFKINKTLVLDFNTLEFYVENGVILSTTSNVNVLKISNINSDYDFKGMVVRFDGDILTNPLVYITGINYWRDNSDNIFKISTLKNIFALNKKGHQNNPTVTSGTGFLIELNDNVGMDTAQVLCYTNFKLSATGFHEGFSFNIDGSQYNFMSSCKFELSAWNCIHGLRDKSRELGTNTSGGSGDCEYELYIQPSDAFQKGIIIDNGTGILRGRYKIHLWDANLFGYANGVIDAVSTNYYENTLSTLHYNTNNMLNFKDSVTFSSNATNKDRILKGDKTLYSSTEIFKYFYLKDVSPNMSALEAMKKIKENAIKYNLKNSVKLEFNAVANSYSIGELDIFKPFFNAIKQDSLFGYFYLDLTFSAGEITNIVFHVEGDRYTSNYCKYRIEWCSKRPENIWVQTLAKDRATTSEINNLPNPVAGLIVISSDDGVPRVFNGTSWFSISIQTLATLDTPYHATQMSKLGILDSYHNYLTELHEYEKSQNAQSDSEIMALNVLQPPVIPTEVEEYAKEYNLF